MEIKSTIFVIILGIAIGYLARHYHDELDYAKTEVIRLCRKALSIDDQGIQTTEGQGQDVEKKKPKKAASKEIIFTKSELWKYYRGGKDSKGLHIAIMGRVYDVKKGAKHYGPDGAYSFFAGEFVDLCSTPVYLTITYCVSKDGMAQRHTVRGNSTTKD